MNTKTSHDRMIIRIIPCFARQILRLIVATMKIDFVNYERVWSMWGEGKNVIVAFWHGRLAMMPFMYRGGGITVLISQHRDGELVARTIKGFGIRSVRGSTTKGSFGGMKGLLKAIRDGRDIAITPDGPNGPRFRVQMGIINIARATGLPIIPMSFSASKKKPLKAGMHSFFHIPFLKGFLYAANLLRLQRILMKRLWIKSVYSLSAY